MMAKLSDVALGNTIELPSKPRSRRLDVARTGAATPA